MLLSRHAAVRPSAHFWLAAPLRRTTMPGGSNSSTSSLWITWICSTTVIKHSCAIPRRRISMNVRQSVVNGSGMAIAVQPGGQAEIELKLLAPQGTIQRLREMPLIVQHARNRGAFRWLETVYYDTPEHLLFQHGMSLR